MDQKKTAIWYKLDEEYKLIVPGYLKVRDNFTSGRQLNKPFLSRNIKETFVRYRPTILYKLYVFSVVYNKLAALREKIFAVSLYSSGFSLEL